MSTVVRNTDKFSCTTSRFLLPTFRRPCYSEITKINVNCNPANEVFSTWSKEEGQYYHIINTALLNDDYDILKENVQFINSLKTAIRNNNIKESVKVYRGLTLPNDLVKQEYKVGLQFLWPTFTCTSRNKDIARGFGNYIFEIDATNDDCTYRVDISKYSDYPEEQEILFYPYSGYVVQNIIPDAKIIQLKCIDTLQVESLAKNHVPTDVKLFDSSRNIFVYFSKDHNDVHWCYANKPDEMYLIAANQNGYWDAPYRYHHRNGYFIDKGNHLWEEYHNHQVYATFERTDAAMK